MKAVLRLALPAVVLFGGAVAWASVPTTFKDGDTLSAQALDDDFASLDGRLQRLETAHARETADGGYSLGATYCGQTGNTTGDLSGLPAPGSGYAKARAQCQTACSSATAHMCTAEELVRSRTVGKQPVEGWYSSGVYAPRINASSDWIMDCVSWSNGTTDREGMVWESYGPNATSCNASVAVLCCD